MRRETKWPGHCGMHRPRQFALYIAMLEFLIQRGFLHPRHRLAIAPRAPSPLRASSFSPAFVFTSCASTSAATLSSSPGIDKVRSSTFGHKM
jgi:hypothetical protein